MRLICVLLTLSVLGVTPAYADNDVEPEVEVLTVNDCEMIPYGGKDYCGLSIDEWRRVLKTNSALEHKNKLLYAEQQKSAILERQKLDLQRQLEISLKSQALLAEREGKLTKALIDLDKKYQDERVKPRWGNPVVWTVAAVSTAALVGFVAHEALN